MRKERGSRKVGVQSCAFPQAMGEQEGCPLELFAPVLAPKEVVGGSAWADSCSAHPRRTKSPR